jgi:predicted RNA-binding Zn ribbon-like protein
MVSKGTGKSQGLEVADSRLCLDFINTEGVERNSPPDRLDGLDLFLEWAAGKGLVDAGGATALRRTGDEEAAGFLDLARDLREALYRTFAALVEGKEPAAGDLAVLDRQLSAALPNLRLARHSGSFDWTLPVRSETLAELLWPISLSAADLLRSDRLDRVKECRSETCSWMFIDESRNRSRRWCDMSDCGNRAKVRRFYQRHSGAG